MYKITEHCQKCDAVEIITVSDEMYDGGVDAEWHCDEPMVWDDNDVEYLDGVDIEKQFDEEAQP